MGGWKQHPRSRSAAQGAGAGALGAPRSAAAVTARAGSQPLPDPGRPLFIPTRVLRPRDEGFHPPAGDAGRGIWWVPMMEPGGPARSGCPCGELQELVCEHTHTQRQTQTHRHTHSELS